MAPPHLTQKTPNCSLLLIYWPQKDERLSGPGWLIYSRWFTHIRGHPSATDRAQDKESSPAKDRRSTVVPCNQGGAGHHSVNDIFHPLFYVRFYFLDKWRTGFGWICKQFVSSAIDLAVQFVGHGRNGSRGFHGQRFSCGLLSLWSRVLLCCVLLKC